MVVLQRAAVRPFTERQIKLVESFADQAVIAIENIRLFEAEQQRTRELAETLVQQTATADVLSVISSSPGELEPVFNLTFKAIPWRWPPPSLAAIARSWLCRCSRRAL